MKTFSQVLLSRIVDIRKKAQTHDCECICTRDINGYQNNYVHEIGE